LAGLVRGTIAFALVLKISPENTNRGVIVTTTLMIVVVTTLVFGSAMPFMSRLFLNTNESLSPMKDKELKELSDNSEHIDF
jgi:NhaP-type Na+/H+ or K+/H+ antiporter